MLYLKLGHNGTENHYKFVLLWYQIFMLYQRQQSGNYIFKASIFYKVDIT